MRLPPPLLDPAYTYVREHDVREWWDTSIAPHAALGYQQRVRLTLKEISTHLAPGSRILDVGCAQGTLGLLLAEANYDVTLLDVREAHIRYAKALHERGRVDFKVGLLSEQIAAKRAFDAVVCTEVLEHVPGPGLLLADIAVRLKPGGTLFLTTPNADYYPSRLPSYGGAPESVIEGAEPNSCDGDAHRYLFSRPELAALLRGVGYRIDEIAYALPFWTQGHLKTRHAISLWHKVAGQLPRLREARVLNGALARRFACFLLARARVQ